MKMRKKIAALLAAAMIASVMPMSVFADSTNRIDRITTVGKDSMIGVTNPPMVKIKMKDELKKGSTFYLELTDAEWAPAYAVEVKSTTTTTTNTAIDVELPTTTVSFSDEGSLHAFFAKGNLGTVDIDTLLDEDRTLTPREKQEFRNALSRAIEKAEKDVIKKASGAGKIVGGQDENKSVDVKSGSIILPNRVYSVGSGISTFAVGDTLDDYEIYRESSKAIAIKAGDDLDEDGVFEFPIIAKITGPEAGLEVVSAGTAVSSSKHVFGYSDGDKAKIIVGDVPSFYRSAEIAEIKLEEVYANAITKGIDKEDERWFTLELRDPDFTFEVTDEAKLVGERAYRKYTQKLEEKDSYKLSADKTKLAIKIEDIPASANVDAAQGNFVLKGIDVVAARDARDGDVEAVIESKGLFGRETIVIAKRGEYKTKLDVPKDWKYDVVAGTEKEVTFTLSEELANSLTGTRPVTFTFDKGVTIKTNKTDTSKDWGKWESDDVLWGKLSNTNNDKIKELLGKAFINGTFDLTDLTTAQRNDLWDLLYPSTSNVRPGKVALTGNVKGFEIVGNKNVELIDQGKWSEQKNEPLAKRVHIADDRESFTVDNFNLEKDKVGAYTFTMTVNVPAKVTGDITVSVDGKGVNPETIKILEAEAPVTVDTTGVDIKVGLKEIKTEGRILIKESAAGRLRQGKDIVLRIDDVDSGLKIKDFKATVIEGDLLLDDANGKWLDKDQAKGVKRSSKEASTIEITDIVMYSDRTVPQGKYDLLIGGTAISDHAVIGGALDPVKTEEGFVNITTLNTEDIADPVKATVAFTVGSADFLINGETATMDAAAYVKDGRTMVPVRYVAQALGVNEEQVTWDGPSQTATIIADKVIQVKLGSKAMLVNGANVPMEAAAELTNDRTFVPMGDIARALGVVVEWNNETKTATFNPAK